ncbi:MAG: chemotaxis protein CheR [Sorangium cellulosum]|nr:MAG: chemotaxis protein CheR [Sorangium cellulosum]
MKQSSRTRTPSHYDEPILRQEDFRHLRAMLTERTGHEFGDDHIREFERRLRPRVVACGFSCFAQYQRFVRNEADEEELQVIYDLITNNETYFFREDYQLRSFRDETLPILLERSTSRKQLTCWSMGCSTGEEAYSIAAVLLESMMFDGWNLRVLGTDLCRTRVAKARRAIYSESSFRSTSPERRLTHFDLTPEGLQVVPAIQSMCQFVQMNLLDLPKHAAIDQVDAIFCRNVLIYFTSEAKKRVIRAIYNRLRPGGYLMLGHSESLLNEPGAFEPVYLKHDVAYHRPLLERAPEREQGEP